MKTWQEALIEKAPVYGDAAFRIVRTLIQQVEGENPHLRAPPRADRQAEIDAEIDRRRSER